jgi:hypothetical protein
MPSPAAGGLQVTPVGFSAGSSAADADTELVVIVRSKRNPDRRSEIYVVNQASTDLLSEIVSAARQGAAPWASEVAARQQAPTGGSRQLYQAPPVVRAQSNE